MASCLPVIGPLIYPQPTDPLTQLIHLAHEKGCGSPEVAQLLSDHANDSGFSERAKIVLEQAAKK